MTSSAFIISSNIRDALGLSQKRFAELINISAATLVNIESGKKSFRLKTLDGITNVISIPLNELSDKNFMPPKNLREKLIKKYEKEPAINVILSTNPSITYGIKYKVLSTDFLNIPKETNDIKKFLQKSGMEFKGNSCT
jgi:transcriptional regulator with XRE-family HTH domain